MVRVRVKVKESVVLVRVRVGWGMCNVYESTHKDRRTRVYVCVWVCDRGALTGRVILVTAWHRVDSRLLQNHYSIISTPSFESTYTHTHKHTHMHTDAHTLFSKL